jgi:hypothetical protein
VPFSMEHSRASCRPGFTLAVTRYRTGRIVLHGTPLVRRHQSTWLKVRSPLLARHTVQDRNREVPDCREYWPRTPVGCGFHSTANPGWLAGARSPRANFLARLRRDKTQPGRAAGTLAPGGAKRRPGFRSMNGTHAEGVARNCLGQLCLARRGNRSLSQVCYCRLRKVQSLSKAGTVVARQRIRVH